MNRTALALLACTAAACGSTPPPMDPVQANAEAAPAVAALQRGDFAGARTEADRALAGGRRNATAAAVRALAKYQAAGSRFRDEFMTVVEARGRSGMGFDHARGRAAWREFEAALAAVDADLAIAAQDATFALELCLACWEHDWNHTGEVDDNDRLLFQVEVDGKGEELPENDPRRRPTFRFDRGDIDWARAMIAFQRGLSELVLAYKWTELDNLLRFDMKRKIVIQIDDASRMRRARDHIRAGLAFSDRSRELYLAETDDNREWVPSPRQKDYAVPLVMDKAMYDTWAGVTRDVRALVDGKEGLPIDKLLGPLGKGGYLDIGRLFESPRDIVIDIPRLAVASEDSAVQQLMQDVFGPALVKEMPRSPLVDRVLKMKAEIDRDEDTFARKMRYFLWIN